MKAIFASALIAMSAASLELRALRPAFMDDDETGHDGDDLIADIMTPPEAPEPPTFDEGDVYGGDKTPAGEGNAVRGENIINGLMSIEERIDAKLDNNDQDEEGEDEAKEAEFFPEDDDDEHEVDLDGALDPEGVDGDSAQDANPNADADKKDESAAEDDSTADESSHEHGDTEAAVEEVLNKITESLGANDIEKKVSEKIAAIAEGTGDYVMDDDDHDINDDILPGVPTPDNLLPGVPTPTPILPGVPTPDDILPGVPTPTPFGPVTPVVIDENTVRYYIEELKGQDEADLKVTINVEEGYIEF